MEESAREQTGSDVDHDARDKEPPSGVLSRPPETHCHNERHRSRQRTCPHSNDRGWIRLNGIRKAHPDYGIEHEIFVSVPGAEISKDHELVKTIEACHRRVLGVAPKHATVLWDSDASVMTRFGIETLNYGPSSGPRDAEGEKVAIETLVNTTKVYALAVAELCGAH